MRLVRARAEEEAERLLDLGFFAGRGFNDMKGIVQEIKRRLHDRRADAQDRAGGQSGAEIMRMFRRVRGVEVLDAAEGED